MTNPMTNPLTNPMAKASENSTTALCAIPVDEVIAAARDLARAGRWRPAPGLPGDDQLARGTLTVFRSDAQS